MKFAERGIVIEESTFVPLIRGLVSQNDYQGALDLINDMVLQGVQPRLRCLVRWLVVYLDDWLTDCLAHWLVLLSNRRHGLAKCTTDLLLVGRLVGRLVV